MTGGAAAGAAASRCRRERRGPDARSAGRKTVRIGRDRYRRNDARCRFRRLLNFHRLLLTRDELFARARVRDRRLRRIAGAGIAVTGHDLVGPVARLDDGRQRRQHRAAEHGAVSEGARRPKHRQAEHRDHEDQTAAPAGCWGVIVVVVGTVGFANLGRLDLRGRALSGRRRREGRGLGEEAEPAADRPASAKPAALHLGNRRCRQPPESPARRLRGSR